MLISLAVVEHRLISARVRCEWVRLRGKGLASVWLLAFTGWFPCWGMLGLGLLV